MFTISYARSMRVTLATMIALAVLALSAVACSPDDAQGLCPRRLATLVVKEPPQVDHVTLADVSRSAPWTSAEYVRQVQTAASRAVAAGGSFRVVAFGGSASGTLVLLHCEQVAPLIRGEDGRATATERVVRLLHGVIADEFDDLRGERDVAEGVHAGPTDVYGAFHAVADLPFDTPRRVLNVTTDGVNLAPQSSPPRLDRTAVYVYGVGRLRGGKSLTTARAQHRARVLERWLRAAGASPVRVSTQLLTGGAS